MKRDKGLNMSAFWSTVCSGLTAQTLPVKSCSDTVVGAVAVLHRIVPHHAVIYNESVSLENRCRAVSKRSLAVYYYL